MPQRHEDIGALWEPGAKESAWSCDSCLGLLEPVGPGVKWEPGLEGAHRELPGGADWDRWNPQPEGGTYACCGSRPGSGTGQLSSPR